MSPPAGPAAMTGRRVLVVTNMWPTDDAPTRGVFVRDQVSDLRRVAPDWVFDVLVIDGRRGRREYLKGWLALRRRLRAGYDLVHAHYGLTGLVAAAQLRVPVVVTYHGSDVYIRWQRAISRLAALRADAIIVVSDRLRRELGTEDAHVVSCGVDLDIFRPLDRRDARRRLGVDDDAPVALFAGDPARSVKDYPLFRAALDALPGPYAGRVQELTLGDVPHEQVPLYLNAANAVVVTSRYEGAGSVAKEALACDVPVVSVDVGDVRAMLDGVEACAVTGRDAGELAAALVAALDEGRCEGRRRLRETGTDAETVARRLLDVYQTVLDEGGRRGR